MDITQIIPQIQCVEQWNSQQTVQLKNMPHVFQTPVPDARLCTLLQTIFDTLQQEIAEQHLFSLLPQGKCLPELPDTLWEKPDAYFLCVEAAGVIVCAASARGFFYAISTLQKLCVASNTYPTCSLQDWADTAVRCDYLEFRNFYPDFEHVLTFFPEMAQRHINALILELEDKRPFPQHSFLQNRETGFTPQQIDALRQAAFENFIELIPLQQTFGHLEYVLRHPQYQALREVADSPGEICPSNPESVRLAKALVKDIAQVFPESRYLHLGCDEVWSLGKCTVCVGKNFTPAKLVIDYVNQLVEAVCTLGKTPLLWHDMLSGCTAEELRDLDHRAIVVLWMYDGNDMMFRAQQMLTLLQQSGVRVWGGCAVRCWDQSGLQNYPVLQNRKTNIILWSRLAQKYTLEGVINTNWSAYSALACPYGVYETSLYPAFFAAEQLWNTGAQAETFLARFLCQYHGIADVALLQEGWQFEDYFAILPRLRSVMRQKSELAQWMEAVQLYERAAQSEFPASLQFFRIQLYGDEPAEWESMRQRYMHTFSLLAEAKLLLRAALLEFVSEKQATAYLASRYALWELLEKEILRLAAQARQEGFLPVLTEKSKKR